MSQSRQLRVASKVQGTCSESEQRASEDDEKITHILQHKDTHEDERSVLLASLQQAAALR